MARPRQVSDEDIYGTARRVFLEHGPGVSVSVIADELGISQAALFKRCGTKKALLIAALAPQGEPAFFDWLREGPTDAPLREQLRELFGLISAFFKEMVPCISALRASGLIDADAFLREQPEPFPLRARRLLTEWFERAQARGLVRDSVDCDALATITLGALQVRAFFSHISGSPFSDSEPRAYLDEVVSILVDGADKREERA